METGKINELRHNALQAFTTTRAKYERLLRRLERARKQRDEWRAKYTDMQRQFGTVASRAWQQEFAAEVRRSTEFARLYADAQVRMKAMEAELRALRPLSNGTVIDGGAT